jgi:hypothetical protein
MLGIPLLEMIKIRIKKGAESLGMLDDFGTVDDGK